MDLFVFTFKDNNNTRVEITAPSKTQAKRMVQNYQLGGGVLRYDSHRPETAEEAAARRKRGKEQKAREEQQRAKEPRIIKKRLAYGRNDRCPCGSGKKVKHCCARKPDGPRPKTEQPSS